MDNLTNKLWSPSKAYSSSRFCFKILATKSRKFIYADDIILVYHH